MNATTQAEHLAKINFDAIPLNAIAPSSTHIQKMRRLRFDKPLLQELADSIKSTQGIVQPIVVRPHPKPNDLIKFELVCGERRWIATGLAAFGTISASVRDLDDEQVLEIQLVENLQREGLHEMEEAEGYNELMKLKKLTADQVADKIGKSRRYVFNRLKLLDLCDGARKAFYAGEVNASVALYLARIPAAELQLEALTEVGGDKYEEGAMSAREALDFIQRRYMLRLDQAPFQTSDITLVPKAGPCTSCPKRTGNQPELFGDIKSKDVCTDPKCFETKREAHIVIVRKAAEAKGQTVITGKAAKQIAPYGEHSLKGFVAVDAKCYEDSKSRTYRAILGKDLPPPKLLEIDDDGTTKMIEVVQQKDIAALLKSKGIGVSRSSNAGNDDVRRRERKARLETQIRARILHDLREAKRGKPFDGFDLRLVARGFFDRTWYDNQKRIAAMWTQPASDGKRKGPSEREAIKAFEKCIDLMGNDELALLMLDLALVGEVPVGSYNNTPATQLLAAAKRAKVNVEAIRAELSADATAKKKPAKKATRK